LGAIERIKADGGIVFAAEKAEKRIFTLSSVFGSIALILPIASVRRRDNRLG
jgi:hypothetical protein